MTDTTSDFDALLPLPAGSKYVLRLYVAGNTPQSAHAVENIKRLCEARLKDRYELTVIDLHQQPEKAAGAQIAVAPTLVKKLPLPLRRLIGDLSNTRRVLIALDIKTEE